MFTVKDDSVLPSRLENSMFEGKQKGRKYPINSISKRKPFYQKQRRQTSTKDSLPPSEETHGLFSANKDSKIEEYRKAIFNTDSFEEADNYKSSPYLTGHININTIYGGCD
jgi:hypothetical protein